MFFKMFKRFLKSGPGLKKLEKMRKNRQKWAKIAAPESPNIHYLRGKSRRGSQTNLIKGCFIT